MKEVLIMIKKFLSAVLGFAAVMAVSVTAYAYEPMDEFYADESIANDISSNLYGGDLGSYFFLYGTQNVTFDFEKAMPFYFLAYSKSFEAETAADMLRFSGYYIVPTLDANNDLIAFTEFQQIDDVETASEKYSLYLSQGNEKQYNNILKKSTEHSGEWEITGTSVGGYNEEFYNFICSDEPAYSEIMSYEQAYLTEDNIGYNILLISDNEEKYFSFYNYLKNENYFISGEELLENAREQYTEFLNSDGDVAGAEGDGADFEVSDNWIVEYPDEETEDTAADDTKPTETETVTVKEEPEAPNPKTGHYPVSAVLAAVSAAAICVIGANKHSGR